MDMRENAVREWVHNAFLKVLHVSGRINPADIFTKEMHDGAHFWCLKDSFMCPLTDFLQQSLLDVHLSCQHNAPLPLQVIPSAASSAASFTRDSYLMALFLSPLSGTMITISHLSSAGCHIFQLLYRVVPLILIWHWWMNPDYLQQVSVSAPFWSETVFRFGVTGTETVFKSAFCFGTTQNRFLFWRPCGPK
jgi:hypothetical protein